MDKKKAKISVIVPVYNVEKYLGRCLDSLVNQTMKNIEILLVDDASPDNSCEIINKYQKKFPEMITCIHHKKNIGLGGARNTGIREASADYIIFIDSDDYVASDICEKMYRRVLKNDCDIVCCENNHQKGNTFSELEFFPQCVVGDISEKEIELLTGILTASAVAKLVRKKILIEHQLFFPEQMAFEDIATVPVWWLYMKKLEVVEEPLYYVMENPTSISRTQNSSNYYDLFPAVKIACAELGKRGYHNMSVINTLLLRGFMDEIKYLMSRMTHADIEKLEELKNEVNKYIPNYKENKFLYKIGEPKAIAAAELLMKNTAQFVDVLEHQQWGQFEGSYLPYYKQGDSFWKKIADFCQERQYQIAIWGAGGKGSSFLSCYDPEKKYISYVIDTNEKKWGGQMETGHTICSLKDCMDRIDVVIIMNRLYSGMVKREIQKTKKKIYTIEYDMYLLWGEEEKLEMFIE